MVSPKQQRFTTVVLLLLSLGLVRGAKERVVLDAAGRGYALSTRGSRSFRVRFLLDANHNASAAKDEAHAPIETPMVEPATADAPWKPVDDATLGAGIGSPVIGVILVSTQGVVTLLDNTGAQLTSSSPLSSKNNRTVTFATKAPDAFYGRGAAMANDDALSLALARDVAVTPSVENTATFAPYYFASGDGYAALGVVNATAPSTDADKLNALPLSYELVTTSSGDDDVVVEWRWGVDQGTNNTERGTFTVNSFELYLQPTPTFDAASDALFDLTGRPAVPPLYAFGFLASRWGWTNATYIENVLSTFRSEKYPLDAIVLDFEWFANTSDYGFDNQGEPWYHDFGYHNVTLPSPAAQFAEFRAMYSARFGGIRKPRLGNADLLNEARANGWLLPGGEDDSQGEEYYAEGRNLDFSQSDVRDWYAEHQKHYLDDGVSFFWNDEGETAYYTFHRWNEAERKDLEQQPKNATMTVPPQRHFSLNRAFTPGAARLGCAAWTGDIDPTWDALRETPGMIVNWALAGMPYVASDIGGFNGETNALLLTRWYWLGVFSPVMRVHSTLTATPHFPWLWGEPYASSMRRALDLRYSLLPYHYSLAHAMRRTGRLWTRPLVARWPSSPNTSTTTSTTTQAAAFLDGDLLVAPVTAESGDLAFRLPDAPSATPQNTARPFFKFNDTSGAAPLAPGATVTLANASLDDSVLVFVEAGAIVVLGPPGVQSTDDLLARKANGDATVAVHVYAGADADFVLVEDDGLSTGYQQLSKSYDVRNVTFHWNDAARLLSVAVEGAFGTDPPTPYFAAFSVLLFDLDGSTTVADVADLADGASIQFAVPPIDRDAPRPAIDAIAPDVSSASPSR